MVSGGGHYVAREARPVLLMSEQERSGDQQKEVVNVGCQPSVAASSEPAT